MQGFQSLDVETRLGAVRLIGAISGFSVERPLVLAILGAFQPPTVLARLPDQLPDCDVLIGLLPGLWSPPLHENGVEAFAAAYDEAIAARFPGRRLLRVGFSVGGLVALAMHQGGAFLCVDAPLTTDGVWPLVASMRRELEAPGHPRFPAWIWSVFGIASDRTETRDYRPLLQRATAPGIFLIASEPLEPPRVVEHSPGVLSEADRQFVAQHAGVRTMVVAAAGHDILAQQPLAVQAALQIGLTLIAGTALTG